MRVKTGEFSKLIDSSSLSGNDSEKIGLSQEQSLSVILLRVQQPTWKFLNLGHKSNLNSHNAGTSTSYGISLEDSPCEQGSVGEESGGRGRGHSPDRLLGEVRTGEMDGVREEE